MDKKTIIDIFESTGSLLNGHFVLTSGQHSDKYFQCAKVLQFPEHLTRFSQIISNYFKNFTPELVISPAIGGVVLGTEVGRQLGCRTIFAERKNGKMVIRRGFNIDQKEKVLIVEDVITTGGSVLEVKKCVQDAGAEIVGVAVLVDRSNKSVVLHKNQFSLINLEVTSYPAENMPESLSSLPIQKPGSRFS